MYTDERTWNELERIQGLWVERQLPVLSNIIQKCLQRCVKENALPRLLDLGSGTSFLMAKILSKRAFSGIRYTGIDLDPAAIEIARRRNASGPDKATLHLQSALAPLTRELARQPGTLLLSLSNTWLSIGSREDLSSFLKEIGGQNPSQRQAVLSVVPWDDLRRQYHQEFREWVRIPELGSEYAIRNDVFENYDRIEQTMHIHMGIDIPDLSVRHSFLKMSRQEFESFMKEAGWMVREWIHPSEGYVVTPEESPIPEFFAICETFL